MIIQHIPAKQTLDNKFKAGYKAGNRTGLDYFGTDWYLRSRVGEYR